MHHITSSAAMATFLAQPLDPTLRRILTDRVAQLAEYDGYDLGELASFIIIEPHDTLEAIEAALGFSLTTYDPETVTDHGGWIEVAFVLSDDGFGFVLLFPDARAIACKLLPLVRAASDAPLSRSEPSL